MSAARFIVGSVVLVSSVLLTAPAVAQQPELPPPAEPPSAAPPAPAPPPPAAPPVLPPPAASPPQAPPAGTNVFIAPPPPPPPADPGPATLFGGRKLTMGGFGGVEPAYTRIAKKNAMLMCGEGAVLVNHELSIGAGGCGLVTEVDMSERTHVADDRLAFGFGGLRVRYHLFAREVINVALGATVGAGGLLISKWGDTENSQSRAEGGFFLVEPQASVFLNITRWMRTGISGGYRIVSGIDSTYISNSDIRGPHAGFNLQLGWF